MFATPAGRRFAIALSALTAAFFVLRFLWMNPRYFRGDPPRNGLSNVLLVLVDTLRADHLSLYGYDKPTSRRLDRLAAERGVVLENVRSQAPCTFPSVNSLLTSRSPLEFVGRAAGDFSIPTGIPTLATLLAANGYETAAVSASPIVRSTPSEENPVGGFGAGFQYFDETCSWDFSPCVNQRALELVERLRPPFFLYLHYMDPHDPYILPGARNPRFSGPVPAGPDRELLLAGDVNAFASRLYATGDGAGLEEVELQFLVGRYDESIHYWDEWFGDFLDRLAQLGLMDTTIVVVASDHGEEFLEHGDLKHCRNVYDTTVRVPLIFVVPGAGPRRLRLPATNLDIVPTILDLLPANEEPQEFEGASIAPWLLGRTNEPRRVHQLSWWGEHQAVSDGLYKLVFSTQSRRFSLFNLDVDASERVDVFHQHRRLASNLASALHGQLSRDPYLEGGSGDLLEQQLKSLGYLQ